MPEATESVEKLQSGVSENEDGVPEARNDAIDALLDGEFAVGVWQRTGDKGQFKAIWINEAFTRLTGYNLAEAQRLGERILRRRHRTMLSELINERGSSTTPIHASLPLRAKDGENVDVPVTMTIREDPRTGQPARFIVAQRKSANSATRLLPENHSRGSLELIAKISEILVDYDEPRVLDSLARLIGRRLNTWCGFFVDAGVLRISEDVNEHVQVRRASTARGRTAADRRDPVGRLLSGSEAQSTRIYLDGEHPPGSPSAQLVDLIRQQVQSEAYTDTVLLYPLFGRARTLGLMAALPELGTEPEDGELQTVLYLAARRVGMVLDNAQLHHGEHTMVETLQRTMLPDLDEIEALDVWTYYAASSEHAQVGGDWYDVMDLPGDSSVLVIGDVAGHDIEAAAAMGQLRSVVRAFAAESHDPGDVLARVDRTVDSMRLRRAASLIYVTLTPIEGSDDWDLRYSRAGHLPGLLLRNGHVEQLDGAGGRLVGFGVTERETAGIRLRPGDCVVLYTDGLVERRDRPLQEGVAALQAVLAEADHAEAAMVGESLVRNLAESPEDDVALVVMRVPEPATGPATTPRQRQWRFPAAKESVQLARQAAAATCRTWGLDAANAVELVVSELVANAVLHAWGVVTVSLVDTGAGVRVEVEDENPMPPVPLERHPARVGGYGMHIVSRLADWGWRPSGVGKVVWARVTGDLEGTGL